jgi:ribosomal protein S18 acetylase RimI-like enzyme
MKLVTAKWEQHSDVLKLSARSKFTKGFSGVGMGSVEEYYKRGWVTLVMQKGEVVGFLCVHHCVRKPVRKQGKELYYARHTSMYDRVHSSVYYVGTSVPRQGIGGALIQHAMKTSPNKLLELISEKENEQGLKFYKALGFKVVGEGANSAGTPYWRLMLEERTVREAK